MIAVLLQNRVHNTTGRKLLPLGKPGTQKVATIGPNANARLNLLSGYHGTPPLLVSPLQAMTAVVGAANIGYEVGCNMTNVSWGGIGGGTVNHPPHGVPPHQGVTAAEAKAHIDAAVTLAKNSDIVVIGLGLCGDNYGLNGGRKLGDPEGEDKTCFTIQETETTDRLSLGLPGLQLPLLKAVVATGTPVVLFVINAGPVDLSWAKSNVAAIVSAGYGGEYGGQGIADVLTGTYNVTAQAISRCLWFLDFLTDACVYSRAARFPSVGTRRSLQQQCRTTPWRCAPTRPLVLRAGPTSSSIRPGARTACHGRSATAGVSLPLRWRGPRRQ